MSKSEQNRKMGHIHHKTVFDRGEFVTNAIPNRFETFAVATPGRKPSAKKNGKVF
jgi:hypothetical protein